MANELNHLKEKIASFTRKYYINLLIRGAILTPVVVASYFLLAAYLENTFWFGRAVRLSLLVSFFVLILGCLLYFFGRVFTWWLYNKGLNEPDSAKIIGKHFPSIGDKLLNVIQLSSSKNKNELLEASINQKSEQFSGVNFKEAVDLSKNKKYLRYLLGLGAIFLLFIFIDASIISTSTQRIVKFNQEFSPKAPFDIKIKNNSLRGFFNEDFELEVSLSGKIIPSSAYLILGKSRVKMEFSHLGEFKYVFEKLQRPIEFQIEAAGFYSGLYNISLAKRPEITQVKVQLLYPFYTSKPPEEITNAGNIEIPEGSIVVWKLNSLNADAAYISLASSATPELMTKAVNGSYSYKKEFRNSDQYSISLENQTTKSQDQVAYSIDVVKDQHPVITAEILKDTVSYKSLSFIGYLKDDYGFSGLNLVYARGENEKEKTIKLPIEKNRTQQNFIYHWSLDSLDIKSGDKIYFFLEVWDNDRVNGFKSSRTARQEFSLPTNEEIKQEINNHQELTENKIDQSVQKAKELKKSIDEAQQKLKGKQNLDWQDKKMLEDLLKQKNKMDEMVKELQSENQLLEQKKEALSSENQKIKEKAEQIQKLMDELLDEETKKMFMELEKLLKENSDLQQIQKLLDKMDKKEINIENELERTLQLFKELQFEYKLDQAINDIKNQIQKQEDLSKDTQNLIDKTENKDNKSGEQGENKSSEDLSNQQQQLKDDLEKFEKLLDELKPLGEELKNDQELPSKEEINQLKENEQKSKESLDKGRSKESKESQDKSLSQMKDMQKKLQNGLNEMQMEIDMKNLESLRQIIHGLIKLSFDQEELMKNFNSLQQNDPKYVEASQQQIKLKNDSKVLEDSLLEISKRDAFISVMVTREIGELNDHIDKSVTSIKERRKGVASSEMQFSLTNINNLALMLNDHFDMMMNMVANASAGAKGKGKGKQPASLSKMQEQINNEIQKLKGKQKTGRQFSESMARMAAEQERIRRALQEMQNKLKKENGSNQLGNDIPAKMQQTELDLVNKQITEQTIRRQNEILTRLLEVEKSMREQNMDPEREAKTAKDHETKIPGNFEEYLKLKEREVELLKTLPPNFIPYYKNEVNDYFKRIN